MKRISILLLTMFCGFLLSCEKTPQDMLVGTWEISSKTTVTVGSAEATVENPVQYYKFEEWGEGKIIGLETSTELEDIDAWHFTYVYDKEKGAIIFETWSKKEKTSWIVDKLTNVSLICHSSSNGSLTTFYGNKLK